VVTVAQGKAASSGWNAPAVLCVRTMQFLKKADRDTSDGCHRLVRNGSASQRAVLHLAVRQMHEERRIQTAPQSGQKSDLELLLVIGFIPIVRRKGAGMAATAKDRMLISGSTSGTSSASEAVKAESRPQPQRSGDAPARFQERPGRHGTSALGGRSHASGIVSQRGRFPSSVRPEDCAAV
jgi:hypothetical protein